MSTSKPRFTSIYDSLPQDAQQSLVYQHLIPLLQNVPKGKKRKITGAATRLQKRHATLPDLDLRSKKLEINNMLKELSKDTKRSYVMDISNRNELLDEIVASVASWMNDIWTVAYEHNVDFAQAHNCLLFVSATLERLDTIRMGCKCTLNTMYIPVTLRDKKGEVIKKFEINGAARLEDVALFIWRDVFLSMFTYGSKRHKGMVPKMLGDIENIMGWTALIRMLYTKSKGVEESYLHLHLKRGCNSSTDVRHRPGVDNESDWEDVAASDESSLPDLGDQSDSDESEYAATPAPPDFELPCMRHWSSGIIRSLTPLQRHVETALTAVFETTPSLVLYTYLLEMSRRRLKTRLLESLRTMATTSSDTYAVALEVYTLEHRVEPVVDLLNSHSHLLRPRDYTAMQTAAVFISCHGHNKRALEMLESELLDAAHATRHALLQSFSQMETSASREELTRIIKSRSGTPGRRARVEAWVDSATTPGLDQPNPMMFAAMVMGIGPMPGLNSDDDPYTYLDLDPNDPDLADLRAEYRPDLKKRFESWVDVGNLQLKNGSASLLSVYRKIIDMLPFLRASDVTEEMISRIQDRASKQFVCDGLDALLAFVKVQRRKLKQELKKREAKAVSTIPAASSSKSQTSTLPNPLALSATAGPSHLAQPSSPPDRADSPGPPPLEPVPGYKPSHQTQQTMPVNPPNTLPHVDPIQTIGDAPQPAGHGPMGFFNFLAGMAAPGGLAPAPPAYHGGGSSVDDVD